MARKKELTLKKRLEGLAAFLPELEKPDVSFGQWSEREEDEPGTLTIPMFDLSHIAVQFVKATYDLEWVPADINWPEWMQSPEARRLRDDPEAMSTATREQLGRLLTVIVRQERFCEGSLAGAYESGLITAICRRAAQLASELDEGGRKDG